MSFNRFNLQMIVQVILLGVTAFVFIWSLRQPYMLVTSVSLGFVWTGQVIYLVYFTQKSHRDWARLLESFDYEEYTLHFDAKQKKIFFPLYQQFNKITRAFERVKIEKNKEALFFQNTIQHVGTGLLAFNMEGEILICNKAFMDVFNIHKFKYLRTLNKVKPGFPEFLQHLKPGSKELLKIYIGGELLHISVNSSDIKLEGEKIKLVSFQDIKAEIEQGEMETMQKMVRVITHEILNSVSPITLLSAGLIEMLEQDGDRIPSSQINETTWEETLYGLKAIKNRSRGLTEFVESYRKLTKLPEPDFAPVKVKPLILGITNLFKKDIEIQHIEVKTTITPESMEIIADEKLIEQVLINLVKNSIEALHETQSPRIEIKGYEENSHFYIKVKDNGQGMEEEIQEHVFMPFFSTKKSGSGIGLSLSRQIMRLHKGNIKVESEPFKETVFTLVF